MTDSILESVKHLCNVAVDDYDFDDELILHINMVLNVLYQLGVGPAEGFRITGYDEKWTSLLEDETKLNLVKDYVGYKVRMVFDPPTSGATATALENIVKELEWRILMQVEADR